MGLFFTIVAGIVVGGVLLFFVLLHLDKVLVLAAVAFGLVIVGVVLTAVLAFWDYLGTVSNGRSDVLWCSVALAIWGVVYWLRIKLRRYVERYEAKQRLRAETQTDFQAPTV
uniref:hypothetical protein n=1 Tax=uncultured Caulobacter sp. TaxID=158749 RepID=UPI0025DB7D19|nr:hypothetical protein [uncultured Caulobacter sp.]